MFPNMSTYAGIIELNAVMLTALYKGQETAHTTPTELRSTTYSESLLDIHNIIIQNKQDTQHAPHVHMHTACMKGHMC